MHFTMFAPDILFFSAGNIHHDEVNLKLLSFAPGLDDGLVKHVYVWPAPSVPGPGDSNLLSYVYILASSAAAHLDYNTLMGNGLELSVSGSWLRYLLSTWRLSPFQCQYPVTN